MSNLGQKVAISIRESIEDLETALRYRDEDLPPENIEARLDSVQESLDEARSILSEDALELLVGETVATVDVGTDADQVALLADEDEVFSEGITGRYVLVALPSVAVPVGGGRDE